MAQRLSSDERARIEAMRAAGSSVDDVARHLGRHRSTVYRVNLGGGECPLLLIGIEPDRIDGIELARRVRRKLDEAEALRESWRDAYPKWGNAKPVYEALRNEALAMMPPVAEQ